MSRMVINPKFIDAPYELAFKNGDRTIFDPHPRRFNILPPDSAYEDEGKLYNWVISNAIPEYVEVG